ncbi:MAG: hypothetical protein LAT63_06730 [Marinobacter sp.]|nr:hypothetical protein [Marinobacter sp.]
MTKPNPQRLLMNLLTAFGNQPITAQEGIQACELFGVSSNSTRVALARLSAEGLIESCGRARYRLTSRANALASEVQGWRLSLERLTSWQGEWLAVHTAELGRSDKPALRRRNRALQLNGFAELRKDLYLRPANLAGGAAAMRSRLRRQGLETTALVASLDDLAPEDDAHARTLWDSSALEQGYRDTTRALVDWLDKMPELEPEDAARESFIIGDRAIRQWVFDPLLPDALVDAPLRAQFLAALLEFDAAGHGIWRRLYLEKVEPVVGI